MSYSKPRATHEFHNFKHDSFALSESAFAERHGHGFFLHAGSLSSVHEDFSEQDTVEATPEKSLKRRGHFLIFPLGHYSDARTIRVGSHASNDVVVEHQTVAATHAVCVCEAGRAISLWRVAAEHETSVNDAAVPTSGDATQNVIVPNGASLRLGAVRLTYLDHGGFRTLVRQLLGPP